MKIVLPGGTLGVIGGGQLGRMFALEAKRMAYNVVVLSPEEDCPAGQVTDLQIRGDYEDQKALRRFADAIDVATIEFENIPVGTLEQIEKEVPVRPGPDALRIAQNRQHEKTFLSDHGFPVTPFRSIGCQDDIDAVLETELPAVLKTSSSGYDGKGQRMVNSQEQLIAAWKELGAVECVLESFVDFDCEFSVIVARNESQVTHYAPIRNEHRNHILDISSSPANLSQQAAEGAIEVATGIAEATKYVGVMCVEFFLCRDDKVLVNEIAPRPHNSGHLTIEAHETNQFEQQVRAVCNLPLGSTTQHRPAAMANLLGDLWSGGTPAWQQALSASGTTLHLYGKDTPRVGRKMGHLTCIGATVESAVETVQQARKDCGTGCGAGEPAEGSKGSGTETLAH